MRSADGTKWEERNQMDVKDVIGVIFDFNGTMFFDSKKHLSAWKMYVEELTALSLSDEDVKNHICGKSPKAILEHFLGYELNDDMVEQLASEKEGIYRKLCTEDKEGTKLAPGLEKFLDFLAENSVPRTIASAANLANMMYYFETFDLYRWFDPEQIIYHSPTMKDKPDPAMYYAACKLLKKDPSRCLVFEDSYVGILAAQNAGVKNVVVINGDNPDVKTEEFTCITAVVRDYTELNDALEFEYA